MTRVPGPEPSLIAKHQYTHDRKQSPCADGCPAHHLITAAVDFLFEERIQGEQGRSLSFCRDHLRYSVSQSAMRLVMRLKSSPLVNW